MIFYRIARKPNFRDICPEERIQDKDYPRHIQYGPTTKWRPLGVPDTKANKARHKLIYPIFQEYLLRASEEALHPNKPKK